jgi:hypothetical protein
MKFDLEALYALLPAIYRKRDSEQGKVVVESEPDSQTGGDGGPQDERTYEPLKALLSVIAQQVAVLEEDTAQLYDDQFIETCRDWVVPYIGDLVGARDLHTVIGTVFSQRAQVANTLAYRRRKGTAAVLEQLARDVTGWDSRAVEFFKVLATTQCTNHIRLDNSYAPDLRRWEPLERLDTPFDTIAHTADIRRISSGRGKHNIPNVGIFLWRLRGYPLTASPAFKVDKRRYMFSPLGNNTSLYTLPETEDQITHLAEPINVPLPLSRRVLDRYLDTYYGKHRSIFIEIDGKALDKKNLVICDLSDVGSKWAHMPAKKYAVDPVLGRLALPEGITTPAEVVVSFHYGFSADIGGGEYSRFRSFTSGTVIERVPASHSTIQEALDQVKDGGVVEIAGSGRYRETLEIDVTKGNHVELRAADTSRPTLILKADLKIRGGKDARVTLNGLLLSGGHVIVTGKIKELELIHCTLVPGSELNVDGGPKEPDRPSLIVKSADTTVRIDHSILGGLRVVKGSSVKITDSVVDATATTGVAYAAKDDTASASGKSAGGELHVENSTIIGKVNATLIEMASNTIFMADLDENDSWDAPVLTDRRQEGCVRFSSVPLESQVPRRHRCQPADEEMAIRVRPQFTSLRYGNAGYCQLSKRCAAEIRQGADDEAEMGAFHGLYQPQREINLRVRLDEYLRFGLEAGIFYAS